MLAATVEFSTAVKPTDVANIQYTSGTTGQPKGVMLTHRNQVNNGKMLAWGMRYTERDRICVPVPLYHCFGCVIGTMSALASGAAIILPNWTFDPRATLQAVQAERATSLYGVPAMFIAELGLPDFRSYDLSSLRTGMMAGAPCPVEIMKRVMCEMRCAELTIGYGQTESAPVVTMSQPDDPMEHRVSTIGKALPCTEMKIVSVLDGETVPAGEQGEVCARGYMVMKGYDDEPEATARAIDAEGWLHTGDLGLMREDGYIHLTGRAKDMIIRGGENVYPREVEEFLYTHPKVAEAQVVGIPDERLGEVVVGLDPAEGGSRRDRRGDTEILRGENRVLQDPAVCALRGAVSHDRDGKDPEVPDPGDRDYGSGPGDGGEAGDGVEALHNYALRLSFPGSSKFLPSALPW